MRPAPFSLRSILIFVVLGLAACSPTKPPVKTEPGDRVQHADTGVNAASLSADGRYALIASARLPAGLWDLQKNLHLYNWQNSKENKSGIVATGFSPDGHYAATAESENLALWDVTNGQILSYWLVKSPIRALAISRDGHYILIGMENGRAEYIEMETGLSVRSYEHTGPVNSVALSDDGRYAATASDDTVAGLWDVQTGEALQTWKLHDPVRKIMISPKSSYVFTATKDGKVTLFDRKTGTKLKSTLNSKGVVSAAVFSPSEKYLVINTLPEKVTVWDMQKAKALQTFDVTSPILALGFNPEENRILTEDAEGHGNQLVLDKVLSTK